jgi:hypothetical protein
MFKVNKILEFYVVEWRFMVRSDHHSSPHALVYLSFILTSTGHVRPLGNNARSLCILLLIR